MMTMCSGNSLVLTDGAGKVVWRQTGHHYESIDVGEIRKDRPGKEIVVDIDHLPKPPKPLCLFDEQGTSWDGSTRTTLVTTSWWIGMGMGLWKSVRRCPVDCSTATGGGL